MTRHVRPTAIDVLLVNSVLSSLRFDVTWLLHPFCSTHWIVRTLSLKSIIDNFSSLLKFFEKLSECDNTEAGSKANGLLQQCQQLNLVITFFSVSCPKVFHEPKLLSSRHSEKNDLDLYETKLRLNVLKSDVGNMRSDSDFDNFWVNLLDDARSLDLGEPKLPRPRKLPRVRLDENPDTQHSFMCVDQLYRQRCTLK